MQGVHRRLPGGAESRAAIVPSSGRESLGV
jgi:hypothetical protein